MADYIYHSYIYHSTTGVIGVNPTDEAANTTDFETNYKASAVKVDELVVNETTLNFIKSYANFKTLIDGVDIKWSDVKFVKDNKAYDLYLITDSPL